MPESWFRFRCIGVFGIHTRRNGVALTENLNHSNPYTATRAGTKNNGISPKWWWSDDDFEVQSAPTADFSSNFREWGAVQHLLSTSGDAVCITGGAQEVLEWCQLHHLIWALNGLILNIIRCFSGSSALIIFQSGQPFQSKPITDSGWIRSAVPVQTDPPFRVRSADNPACSS